MRDFVNNERFFQSDYLLGMRNLLPILFSLQSVLIYICAIMKNAVLAYAKVPHYTSRYQSARSYCPK